MFRAEAKLSLSTPTDWFYEEKQYCSCSIAWEGDMILESLSHSIFCWCFFFKVIATSRFPAINLEDVPLKHKCLGDAYYPTFC